METPGDTFARDQSLDGNKKWQESRTFEAGQRIYEKKVQKIFITYFLAIALWK
jgi:hypothetical protein